jgi:hypothetical protein
MVSDMRSALSVSETQIADPTERLVEHYGRVYTMHLLQIDEDAGEGGALRIGLWIPSDPAPAGDQPIPCACRKGPRKAG